MSQSAGIAEASPIKTGLRSVRLGFCVYTLPFMFVYNPALLLQGSVVTIALSVVGAIVGVSLLSFGLGGHFLRSTNWLQRLLFVASGIMFVTLDPKLIAVGLFLGAIAVGWQLKTVRREREANKPPSA